MMPNFQNFLLQSITNTLNTNKYFNNEYSFQIELIVQMRFLIEKDNSVFKDFYIIPEYSNKDEREDGGIGESGRLDILIRDGNNKFCVVELKHKCRANSCIIPLNGSGNITLKIRGGNHTNWNNSGKHKGGFSQIQDDIDRCQRLKNNEIVSEAYLVLFTDVDRYLERYGGSKRENRFKIINTEYCKDDLSKPTKYTIKIFEIY